MKRLAAAALAAALALACGDETAIPGVALGTFNFEARAHAPDDCPFREEPSSDTDGGVLFTFRGRFSESPDGGDDWFTLEPVASGTSRKGTFDGQRFDSVVPAPGDPPVLRTFELDPAAGCGTQFRITETMRVVFLSPRQADALGGGCPENPEPLLAEGGVPVDVDAGVLPPAGSPDFDAQAACGLLVDQIEPDQPCTGGFAQCTLGYRIAGARVE